ncbi:MAG: hypothetical protein M3P85_11010 [Actinomycetota bacterium]|nr:hypothetical protein [Actinomycetota bacterium]
MNSPFTSPLRIEAWRDPVIDRLGHAPASAYVEWLWLPRIGPSAAWAHRRLTSGLAAQPGGYKLSLSELAHWLGLGQGTGANSIVVRTLRRLVAFHLAQQVDHATLAVRRRVPPLTRPQLERLSPYLQQAHIRLTNASPAPGLEAEAS